MLCLFDYICHYAPHHKVAICVDANRLKVGVGGDKFDMVFVALYALKCKLSIDKANGRAAVVWLDAAINDDDVALVHLGIDHRRATDAKEEG